MPPKNSKKGKKKQKNNQHTSTKPPAGQQKNNQQTSVKPPAIQQKTNAKSAAQRDTTTQAGPQQTQLSLQQFGTSREIAQEAKSAWQSAKAQRDPKAMTIAEFVAQAPETSARRQWRERLECQQTVRIPDELFLSVEHQQEYEVIAEKHNAFVFHQRENLFGIWGSAEDAKAARQAIEAWIKREGKAKSRHQDPRFTKQHSFTPAVKKEQLKIWERKVRRHTYRQRPEFGEKFGSHGSFIWPDDTNIQTALGTGLEMLDSIRMNCSCFIFLGNDGYTIDALGRLENVEKAIERIRMAYFQVKARELVSTRNYLIHWKQSEMAMSVSAAASREDLPEDHDDESESYMLYRGQDWETISDAAISESDDAVKRLQAVIMNTVEQVRYYPGYLRLKVRISNFLGVQYLPSTDGFHTTDDFKAMVSQSQFIGQSAIGMGDKSLEQEALGRVKLAEHLLQPHDNMIKELFDTIPIYTAIFVFEHNSTCYQLDLQWTEDTYQGERRYTSTGQHWTKLDKLSHEPTKLLDTHLINLEKGTTWNFEMTAEIAVLDKQTLPPALQQFADRVKFNKASAESDRFEPPFVLAQPEASLRALEQVKTWQFRFNDSDYNVELSQRQRRQYTERLPVSKEPRWSVEVTSSDWDKLLAENRDMAIGEGVSWSSDASIWFSDITDADEKEQGHRLGSLLLRLDEIEALLWAESVDESTGMQIG